MDKILVLEPHISCINTWSTIFKASKHEAFVYKFPKASVDWLRNKCDELNASQEYSEWLWSHPSEGGDSTPSPVLIQQNRAKLNTIRDNIGYND